MYNVHCTMYNVHCTMYNVHCIMYSVHCTVYTSINRRNVFFRGRFVSDMCIIYNIYIYIYIYAITVNIKSIDVSDISKIKNIMLILVTW